MAARTRKGVGPGGWPVEVRERIKTSMLINRLTDHALGKLELAPTQVRAIEVLLRKTLPDLSAVEGSFRHSAEPADLSDAELAAIAKGSSRALAPPEDGADELDLIH